MLARVLIATGKSDREADSLNKATRLLGRLLQAAETGGRLGSVIQILLLQALAYQSQDNLSRRSRSAGTRNDHGRAGRLCSYLCG